jgi:hypothetical protein
MQRFGMIGSTRTFESLVQCLTIVQRGAGQLQTRFGERPVRRLSGA